METLSLQIKEKECCVAGKWVMVFREHESSTTSSSTLKHIVLSNPNGYSVILSAELKESGISTPNNAPLC